jgi:6-phosphogluconate dehydrogenase
MGSMKSAQIGIIGLGVMGRMLALNFANHSIPVAGYDLDPEKVSALASLANSKPVAASSTLNDFFDHLAFPRVVLMMVPAGQIVDKAIASLKPYLHPGDILIDGGNSHFSDTDCRIAALEPDGIIYIGMGVSGGEQGALLGPSLMPGGNPAAWEKLQPLLEMISAKVERDPCVSYIGNGSAGHYVKMVHNGIEYGDMQLIAEVYDVLHRGSGISNHGLGTIFQTWNNGLLNSYLIQITAEILTKKDLITGKDLVDMIADEAGQKGTGKWSSQSAFDLGAPIPTIHSAVEARVLSSLKNERFSASDILKGPDVLIAEDRNTWISLVRDALFAAKICSYAQGFNLLKVANSAYKYNLNLSELARIWRGGCIIRASFLDDIRSAYLIQPDLANLMIAPYFSKALNEHQSALRQVVAKASLAGIPVAGLSSALTYYDAYRSERLPANLIQAQRDYFGAHTYRRIDQPGTYHTEW